MSDSAECSPVAAPPADGDPVAIATIRRLARQFDADQLERCLQEELQLGDNECIREGSRDEIVGELAKAEFVRHQVERGVALPDAIRELARRIRAVQRGSEV
jgi:hypothetical protein